MLFMYVLFCAGMQFNGSSEKNFGTKSFKQQRRACNNMKCTFCSGPKTNISFTFLQDSNNGGM